MATTGCCGTKPASNGPHQMAGDSSLLLRRAGCISCAPDKMVVKLGDNKNSSKYPFAWLQGTTRYLVGIQNHPQSCVRLGVHYSSQVQEPLGIGDGSKVMRTSNATQNDTTILLLIVRIIKGLFVQARTQGSACCWLGECSRASQGEAWLAGSKCLPNPPKHLICLCKKHAFQLIIDTQ